MKVVSVASRYSDQPEELLITISRVKDSACPYRYFKGYIERPKAQESFQSIEAGLGTFFHAYVEKHFKGILASGSLIASNHTLGVPDLVANFRLAFLWEGRLRAPYKVVRSTYGLDDFIRRLEAVATNFNSFLVRRLSGHRVVGVEGELQIRTEEFYIRGKHDLITQERGGDMVLWDWKTGSAPRPEYYEDFRNQKVQLGIYAVWMRHKYGTAAVRGTAVYLRDGAVELSERFHPRVEAEVLLYADAWRRRVNAQTSYPPIPNNLCDWCGWNPACPAYQGQAASIPARLSSSAPTIYHPQPASSERRRCFVATAVFEGSDAPEVRTLRAFRDRRLSPHPMGRVILQLYECLGPAAATIFKCSPMRPMAKQVIRLLLRLLPELRVSEADDSARAADPKPVPDRDATSGSAAHTTARGSHVERGV
jgi:hypothetical protein